MSEIATTVLGVLERQAGDEYLLQRLVDPAGGAFYRPIGGVEFGETSRAALEREFREELGVDLKVGPTVGTLENRFTWDGDPSHEVVIVRRATFVDDALYDRDRFAGVDAGGAVEYEATWHGLADLATMPEPLYPEGLAALLRGEAGEGCGHLTDDPDR